MLDRGNVLIRVAGKVGRRKSCMACIADICIYCHFHDGNKGIMIIELSMCVDVAIPVANCLP